MTTVVLTSGTSWTVPSNVTSLTLVEAWGAGASGAYSGGGGGGYSAISNFAVTPGQVINYAIGAGGPHTTATAGGDTWFGSQTTLLAKGGQPGIDNGDGTYTGGLGGQASAGVGTTKFSGGNAGNAGYDQSTFFPTALSGGGAAASPSGNGGNGQTQPGSTQGNGKGGDSPGAGAGGAGGYGTNNTTGDGIAGTSNANGGGGGGSGSCTTAYTISVGAPGGAPGGGAGAGSGDGGAGGDGQIRITYTVALPPITGTINVTLGMSMSATANNALMPNYLQSPTFAGAASGSPGNLPPGWATVLSGLTRTVTAGTTENGLPCMDIRFNGTATGTQWQLGLAGSQEVPAANGDTWTESVAVKLVAGTYPGVFNLNLQENNSSGAFVASHIIQVNNPTSDAINTQYQSATVTLNHSTCAYTHPCIQGTLVSGQAYDFTLRIAEPYVTKGSRITGTMSPTLGMSMTAAASDPVTGTLNIDRTQLGFEMFSFPDGTTDPQTTLHYAAGGNFDGSNNYLPASCGFNLADCSSLSQVNALPAGVKALVWYEAANGADSAFQSFINQFIGNSKVWGFYLADEPDPTGQWGHQISGAQLKAASDYVHSTIPGAKTFMVMMNNGSPSSPQFYPDYAPANTGVDYFGFDPYPVRPPSQQPSFINGTNYDVIPASINAGVAAGYPIAQMIPIYQAFGGGGYTSYTLPTADQLRKLLLVWGLYIKNPAFDYFYAWGQQSGDTSLSMSPSLQAVATTHNTTQTTVTGTINVTLPWGMSAAGGPIVAGTINTTLPIVMNAVGGPVVEGTIDETLPLSMSASGGPIVGGHLSTTLGMTMNASGSVIVAGTINTTLGMTMTGEATIGTTATLDVVLPMTMAAAADVAIDGTISTTIPVVMSGAASVIIGGTMNETLPLSVSAAAKVSIDGTANITLPLTMNASADVAIDGTISGFFDLTMAGAATVTNQDTISGIISYSFPDPTIDATGEVIVGGVLDATMPLAMTGAASIEVAGSLQSVIQLDFEATGQVDIGATLEASLPFAMSALADVEIGAAMYATWPLTSIDAQADIRVDATGDMTLPGFTLTGAASVFDGVIEGILNTTLPGPYLKGAAAIDLVPGAGRLVSIRTDRRVIEIFADVRNVSY